MSEIENGGLDQYGAGLLEQQQFRTAGVEGVNFLELEVLANRSRAADLVSPCVAAQPHFKD